MKDKQNAPASAATLTEAMEPGAACEGGSNSNFNFIMQPNSRQLKIADLLGHGQNAALTRRDLENMTGFDGRTVRETIQQERLNGTPILSDCRRGYYLPEDGAEAEHFIKSMRHRAYEILRVAHAVEKATGLD